MEDFTPEIKFVAEDIRDKSASLVLSPLPERKKEGFTDLVIREETSKRKLKDYSDVSFTDIYAKVDDDTYVAKFPSYSSMGGNQEEYFAQRQSTGEKWKNGALKFLGQTFTGVLGGTAGIVNGAYEFAKTGSFASTYDNDFMNYLDNLNKKWDYQLPNYYTEEEKKAGFTDSLGSANFWAKDVLGGAAFTLSAIGSEALWAWATGGSSLSTTGARLGAKASRLLGSSDEILKAVNLARKEVKLPAMTTGAKQFKNIAVPTELATGLGKAGELANLARFTYTSAGFEAGFEARHYMREMEDNFYVDYQEKHGGAMPSIEEENKFRAELGDSANALYGFNLAVVGTSNLATIGRIYGVKSPLSAPSKWTNSKLFGVGVKETEEGLTKLTATRAQKVAQNIYTFGKSPITEGLWEEGMQSVGSNTAKNWVEAGYDPKLTRSTYDLGQASIDGFAETYGTKEGWKEIGVGMIIGLLTGSGVSALKGGELADAKKRATNLESYSKYYSPKKMAESIAFANRVQSASNNMEVAESKGDFTSAELARKSAVLSQLNFAYNLDYLDESVKESAIAIDNIDNESLMKEYEVDAQGAEDLKSKMKEEYIQTAKEYKKNRDFAEYFIGKEAKKEGLNELDTSNAKQAIAYELTLGSQAYKFSSDILETLKTKIASGYTDVEITTAMDVDNILSTASVEVERQFQAKKQEVINIKNKKEQLEKEKDDLMKVLLDESQEQKVSRLQKLNNVEVELARLTKEEMTLGDEANALLNSAKLNNPFNENPSQQYLSLEQIQKLDDNLNKVNELANSFRNTSPQRALEIQKLRQEYARSIGAFQRYADLARQLSDPKLGLRGRRNIISEIRSSKTPTDITVETLEGLLSTRELLQEEGGDRVLTQTETVEGTVEDLQKESASMEVAVKQEVQEVVSDKSPMQAIKNIIINNPYLISYKGEGSIPNKPTEAEIGEYYDLATRALASENFDPETIGISGQLQMFSTGENLTEDELNRLKDLNSKLSDWQLYSGAVNDEGLSITDIIEQQLTLDEEIEETIEEEVTEEDFVEMSNPEPKIVEGETIRNEEIGQTYSRVFVRATKDGFTIANLGIQKFLNGLQIADNVTVTIGDRSFDVSRGDVSQHSAPSAVFTVTFLDGTQADISIEAGGVIKIEDFNKILNNSNYKTDRYVAGKQSGYSLLYDGDNQVESDFKRIDDTLEYTDSEYYNIDKDASVGLKVNMEDPYNKQLAEKLKNKEITKEQFEASLKIYIVDDYGNILGDLKANRDVTGFPEFLEIRATASKMALIGKESQFDIPHRANIKYLFLGVPNFEFTEDGYKEYEMNPDTIVDFGYTENGNLVLNGDTKNVRKSLITNVLKKDGIPIIVFKMGKNMVAFPVKLIKVGKNLGDEAEQTLLNSTTPSESAKYLNQLLIDNNLSPKKYNLYYADFQNQTLYNEDGSLSDGVRRAIDDLNLKQDFMSPKDWKTKEDVVGSSTINIDLENTPLVSPKPVLEFYKTPTNVYERHQNGEELTEEEITEFASKAVEDRIALANEKASLLEQIGEAQEAITTAKERIEQSSVDKAKLNFKEGFERIDEYSYRSTKGTVWIVPNTNPTVTDEEGKVVKFVVLNEEKLFNSWKRADNKRINDTAKNPTKKGEIERAFTKKITDFLFDNGDELLVEIPKAKYSKKDALLATNLETSIANNLETIERETARIEELQDKLSSVPSTLSERDQTIISDKKVQQKVKEMLDNEKTEESKNNLKKPC